MSQISAKAAKIKPEKTRRPPRRITPSYLRNAGLHYLERFAASTGGFRAVMTRKIDRSCRAHPDQDREECLKQLESLIAEFRERGLLNDESYVKAMTESLRRRGLSARMIRAKLAAKGVESGAITAALAAYADEEENAGQDAECTAARRLIRRKRLVNAAGEYGEKAMAALARAGFGYDTVRRALEEEAQEILRAFSV